MHCNFETTLEPDGRWVSRMPALPGWAAFGNTPEESVSLAKKVADILLEDVAEAGTVALPPHPEHFPDAAQLAAPPPGSESPAALAGVVEGAANI